MRTKSPGGEGKHIHKRLLHEDEETDKDVSSFSMKMCTVMDLYMTHMRMCIATARVTSHVQTQT